MQLGNVWLRVGGGLLAVATFLQLEVKLSHVAHVVIACVVVLLTYLLGKKDETEGKKEQVNL